MKNKIVLGLLIFASYSAFASQPTVNVMCDTGSGNQVILDHHDYRSPSDQIGFTLTEKIRSTQTVITHEHLFPIWADSSGEHDDLTIFVILGDVNDSYGFIGLDKCMRGQINKITLTKKLSMGRIIKSGNYECTCSVSPAI